MKDYGFYLIIDKHFDFYKNHVKIAVFSKFLS